MKGALQGGSVIKSIQRGYIDKVDNIAVNNNTGTLSININTINPSKSIYIVNRSGTADPFYVTCTGRVTNGSNNISVSGQGVFELTPNSINISLTNSQGITTGVYDSFIVNFRYWQIIEFN